MKMISEKRFRALGTDIHLKIAVENEKEKLLADNDIEKAEKIYNDQEKIFSRFDSESELGFFNRNLGGFHEASSDFLEVSRKIIEYHARSGGVFDPRIITVLEDSGYKESFEKEKLVKSEGADHGKVFKKELSEDLKIDGNKVFFGTRMDFSGIVKGYATDKASEFFKKNGWGNFLADSGGDIFASGKSEYGEKWVIGFEDIPEEKLNLVLENEAVATSGTGRRKWEHHGKQFHHLIDPRNPENFSFDLRSVSVIAENVEEADFLAKYLFILGEEDGLRKAKEKGIRSVFLNRRGDAFLTKEIRGNVLG